MPEAIGAVFDIEGIWWLLGVMSIAGLVRGFAGFGTALIFVPVAGQYLPPADVVMCIVLTGILSSGALVPRALRESETREVGLLVAVAVVTLPFGIWLLSTLDVLVIRWAVSIAASITLLVTVSGFRLKRSTTKGSLVAAGGGTGLLAGMTGLTGPVVILFYLISDRATVVIRANIILVLAAMDVLMAGMLLISGVGKWQTIFLALVLAVPYIATSLLGQALFRPRAEPVYRWVAYGAIALAVLTGMPLFD